MTILFADRSERGKLRFTGEQRAWFLHQVLTQAFEDAAPGEARDAALITVHGRMRAFMETIATDDSILMHFEPELLRTLPAELERYVFATRVGISDVTDELGLVLVVGDRWQDLVASSGSIVAAHPTSSLGVDAGYVWVERGGVAGILDLLSGSGAETTSEDELEALRISHGVPRWGREMDDKTFPQEAGVDSTAVRYDKGCYLGQEAMAKIHFRGKVNRRLAVLESSSPLEPGAEVRAEDLKVGNVTSAAADKALALVRYTLQAGARVDAGGVPATVAS